MAATNEDDVKVTTGYRPLTSSDSKRARLVTIEPVMVCFMLGDGIYYGIQSECIQQRIASLHNYTLPNNAENGTCSMNESSAENQLQSEIQAEASEWIMYFTLAYTLPAIFMTAIIGSWSDSIGRKPALIIPCAGSLVNLIVWTIVAGFELPLEILVASAFLRGMSGGTSLFMAASFTYISDVTTKENRTTRIIVCECAFLISFSSGQLFGGLLLNVLSFAITYAVGVFWTLMAIIYTAIPYLLRETVTVIGSFKNNLKRTVKGILIVLTKKDLEYKKTFAVINFVYLITLTFTMSTAVFGLLTIHFLSEPFCFTYLVMSYYTAALSFTPTIGLIMSALLLDRWLNDYWLIQLSMFSAIVFHCVSATAQTTPLAFIGAGFGIFKGVFGPPCRSILSKMSSPEEQGAVFGVLGMVDAFASFISPLILNNIFSATVYSMPTFVFWLCGGFSILPIISVCYLQYNSSRGKKQLALNSSDTTPSDNSSVN